MPAPQSFSYRDVTCRAYRGFSSAALSRDYLSAAPAASSGSGTCYTGRRKSRSPGLGCRLATLAAVFSSRGCRQAPISPTFFGGVVVQVGRDSSRPFADIPHAGRCTQTVATSCLHRALASSTAAVARSRSAWLGGRFAETCCRWPNVNAAGPLATDPSRDKQSCLSHLPPADSRDVQAAFTWLF